jgi:putative hydrolase of the HAD superfamily
VTQRLAVVLFDLDGTLVDHHAATKAALHAWLPGYGLSRDDIEALESTWATIEQRHHRAWEAGQISFTEQRRRRLRDFLPVIGQDPPDHRLDAIFAEYLACYQASWTAFDDAAPALARVTAAGLRTAILTNGDQTQQTAKLAATGLLDRCGPVFASSHLPAAKPDPRAYRHVCRHLAVAPDQVLMVGDNYDFDVLAARAAGLSAIHLDRSAASSAPAEGLISTLRDLSP